jgi:hypothetical protein
MLLVEWLDTQPYITRKMNTPAGWILEAVVDNVQDEMVWKKKFLNQISCANIDPRPVELIYSIYLYRNIADRFSFDATLRQNPTVIEGTFSSSQLVAGDLYIKATPFDFDALTLNDGLYVDIYFTIDNLLPNLGPGILFKEIDIHGSQFEVVGPVAQLAGFSSVPVRSGMNF